MCPAQARAVWARYTGRMTTSSAGISLVKTLRYEFAGDPERLARFRREARTLASLHHPNIGPIYGLEESGAVDCLVLELVEGETLHGPRPTAGALDCARKVAKAGLCL